MFLTPLATASQVDALVDGVAKIQIEAAVLLPVETGIEVGGCCRTPSCAKTRPF